MKTDDIERSILASGKAFEALGWLTKPGVPERTLGEATTHETSMALVKSLYELGAVRVWVFDIVALPTGEENSGRLIVQLPESPDKRKRLLKKCAEVGAEQGFDPEPDQEQCYTLLMLD